MSGDWSSDVCSSDLFPSHDIKVRIMQNLTPESQHIRQHQTQHHHSRNITNIPVTIQHVTYADNNDEPQHQPAYPTKRNTHTTNTFTRQTQHTTHATPHLRNIPNKRSHLLTQHTPQTQHHTPTSQHIRQHQTQHHHSRNITNKHNTPLTQQHSYRDWETDRKSTRLNSSHRSLSRMPSSA